MANLAPNMAIWVATTFGHASTGVAISSLSGAAASNATLAWLGGGAVAAGGGGVASGQALLALAGPVGIGVGAAGVLISLITYWIKQSKIREEEKEATIILDRLISSLHKLFDEIDYLCGSTESIRMMTFESIRQAKRIRGKDYTKLNESEKMILGELVNYSKSLSHEIGKVVNEDGSSQGD